MRFGELMSVEKIKKLIETEEGIQLLRESVDPSDREEFEAILKVMLKLRGELKELDKEMADSHGIYVTNQEGKA